MKFAVVGTWIKKTFMAFNIRTDLRIITAMSEDEAIGVYVKETMEGFSEYQMSSSPIALQIPKEEDNESI